MGSSMLSLSRESIAAKMNILLTEKTTFKYVIEMQTLLFYKYESTVCWLWTVLDDLSTFEYIKIMMMFW
jgi:hypothetical protein